MLRYTWLFFAAVISLLIVNQHVNAASLDINNYNVYVGDTNGDGFSDYYFENKNKPFILLLSGDITLPIIIRPINAAPNFVIKSLGLGLGYSDPVSFNLDPFNQSAILKSLHLAVANTDYFIWDTGYLSKQVILLRGATITEPSILLQSSPSQTGMPVALKTFATNIPEANFSNKSLTVALDSQYGDSILQFLIGGTYKFTLNLDNPNDTSPQGTTLVNPKLVSPSNGTLFEYKPNQNPCFVWTRGSSTTTPAFTVWQSYHVVLQVKPVYSESDAIAIYDESNNATTSACWNAGKNWRVPSSNNFIPLRENVTYYWFVVTSYGTGWNANNSIVGPYSFLLKPKPLTDSETAIRLLWSDVANAIKNNDRATLTDRFNPKVIGRYNQVFDALGASQLSQIGGQLGEIDPLFVTENTAIYLVTKINDDSTNSIYTIKFDKNENGDWKVSEL